MQINEDTKVKVSNPKVGCYWKGQFRLFANSIDNPEEIRAALDGLKSQGSYTSSMGWTVALEGMNKLQSFIQSKPGGFLTAQDMPELIKLDRLFPVLVRCGACRFTAGAQYIEHLIKCIEAGGDYVRDVSFPVGSLERAAAWVEDNELAKLQVRAANGRAAGLVGQDYQKAPVYSSHRTEFNESDCGGVFDGHQVTSDADPGL